MGIHLELTGDDVTECTGGPQELNDEHLNFRCPSLSAPWPMACILQFMTVCLWRIAEDLVGLWPMAKR